MRAGTLLADLLSAGALVHAKAADLFAALAVRTVLASAIFAHPSKAPGALYALPADVFLAFPAFSFVAFPAFTHDADITGSL